MKTSPYLLALVAIIFWGATPAATLIAVEGIDPVTVGLLRTVTAAVILFPLGLFLKLPTPTDRKSWADLVASALTGFAGYTLLFTVGQKVHFNSSHRTNLSIGSDLHGIHRFNYRTEVARATLVDWSDNRSNRGRNPDSLPDARKRCG